MAVNKEFLTKLGVDKDLIGDIMDEHGEVVALWKSKVEKYKAEADKIPAMQGELDKLKAAAEKDNSFEKKYTDLKAEYDKYKAGIEEKETKTAKENAVKAYFESKNIKGNNLKLAMRAAKDEILAVELSDGKIKDLSALDTLITNDLSGLVSTEATVGANVANPPSNNGGTVKTKSRAAELAAQYHNNLYGENPSEKKGE